MKFLVEFDTGGKVYCSEEEIGEAVWRLLEEKIPSSETVPFVNVVKQND